MFRVQVRVDANVQELRQWQREWRVENGIRATLSANTGCLALMGSIDDSNNESITIASAEPSNIVEVQLDNSQVEGNIPVSESAQSPVDDCALANVVGQQQQHDSSQLAATHGCTVSSDN